MKSIKRPRKTNLGGVSVTIEEGKSYNILFDEINGVTVVNDGRTTTTRPLMYNFLYEGKNKTRCLVSIPFNSKGYIQDIIKASKDYDVICSVDTSLLEEEMIVTVGTISILSKITNADDNAKAEITQVCIVNHHDKPPIDFEQMNWLNAIHWIRSDSVPRSILMIVDCDKDTIPDYNARLIPVYGSEYLPDDVTLVYSKDNHNDTWMNQMLDMSDKTSKKIKNQFKEKGLYDFSTPEIKTCVFIQTYRKRTNSIQLEISLSGLLIHGMYTMSSAGH